MQQQRRIVSIAIALLIAGSATTGARTGTGPEHVGSTAVQIREGWQLVAAVTIEDRGPFRFLLDTGASHSALTESLAVTLGARPVARTLVTTPVGEVVRLVVRLTNVRVGVAHAAELQPAVVPAPSAADIWTGLDGVLGQDFLSRFDHTLDYRDRRIWWGLPADLVPDARVQAVRLEGRPLIRLVQRPGPGLTLVPDSGANHVVLFDENRLAAVPLLAYGRSSTLSDRSDQSLWRLPELRAGPIALRDQLAAIVPRPGRRPAEGDGLLPLHVFARVAFTRDEVIFQAR